MKTLKNIADSTKAKQAVIEKYQEKGRVYLFQCENENDADLVFSDCGIDEYFTLDRSKATKGRILANDIKLKDGDISRTDGILLDIIEIKNDVEISDEIKSEIKEFAEDSYNFLKVSGKVNASSRDKISSIVLQKTAKNFCGKLNLNQNQAANAISQII